MAVLKLMPCALVDEENCDLYFVPLNDLNFINNLLAGIIEILASVRCTKCGFVCLGFTKTTAEDIEKKQENLLK